MKTIQVSPEEMAKRLVRFKNLTPRSQAIANQTGIPAEVSEFFAADKNFTYMAPVMPNNSSITRHVAIRGGDAGDCISVSMAHCKPGNGPQLHAHMRTVESFFCLRGRFALKWGDAGENEVILEPYDFIPVPPGVVRTFVNVGDTDGELLVIIQGNRNDFDDVEMTPALAEEVERRFGAETRAKLEASGRRFTAGVE